MAAYGRVDIALDPFPYGGGTTTAEALWMGVPVITKRGDRWTGRVSESILSTLGFGEMVAADSEAYVSTAVKLAEDLPRLRGIRQTLREKMLTSPICDAARFAGHLEALYREAWRHRCLTPQG